jgi:preprotein translocase subunit YajC
MLALLQIARPSAPVLQMVFMYGGLILVFWFVLLRPQRQAQKKHQELVGALKKGDEVMTSGGILGEVVFLKEDRITIKTGESTRIVVARAKIERVFTAEVPDKTTAESK